MPQEGVIALDLAKRFWDRQSDSNLTLSFDKYFLSTVDGQFVLLYSIDNAPNFKTTTEKVHLVDFLVNATETKNIEEAKANF